MANGWAGDGAVQDQIDSTIKDELQRVRSGMPQGESLTHCEECGDPIPQGRREAVPGVRLCIGCQNEADGHRINAAGFNRRGSKDSQLR